MTLSHQTINTYINCGCDKRHTTSLNNQSNIDQIHEHIRDLFGSHLPKSYYLTFYNNEHKKFIKLNQNVLDYGWNPFQLKSSINNQSIENILHFVELYVIDTTDENSDHDTQSGVQCNETGSDDSSKTIIHETLSQSNLPIHNNIINNNDCQEQDLLNALLTKESIDTNTLLDTTYTNDNNINNDESLNTYPNENIIDSNFSSNDLNDSHVTDFFNALLSESQSDQNIFIRNDSLEPIEVGDSIPLQNNSLYSIQHLNKFQNSIQPNEQLNIEYNRLYFSLDVKPEQKDIYKSDKFNQKEETKPNGYITRIQGIKTAEQKMCSVWPKIRIPKSFRNKHNICLAIFVVSEKLENGKRTWYKHRDKGFLPKNCTRDSQSVNPIVFDINESNLTLEGDFELDLPMTTLWNKLKESEKLYQLDEQSTIKLHSAQHESLSPRLFCILKDNNCDCLDTICLSDFIRKKKASKRYLTNTDDTTVQTCTIVYKRAKT
ncbi:unnamed protein product [Rotaria sp. Silwood1]|nr:unnamed protein product [Rotaria sp. Silwood1]CAF1581353.1 unnamed protein product [Rotaria sp. Silwood1]